MSIREKKREEYYDVIVVGGGMSGICAAIASARSGAKTALVHARAVLGGNASSEIRMHICGASCNMTKTNMEETGIINEILLENKRRNAGFNYYTWDTVLLNMVKSTPNLTSYLNTAIFDADCIGNRITKIYCHQQTTELIHELFAKVFIDCSGNGTLGFYCGADYRTGSEGKAEFNEPHAPNEPDNNRMGNTLLFKAVNRGVPVKFETPEWAYHFTEEQLKYRVHSGENPKENIADGKTVCGENQNGFFSFSVDYGFWWIELDGEGSDIITEYEEIRDELVKCVYGIWGHIKNDGDHGAQNYDLEWVGMFPGTRESRRFEGDYIFNENDIINGRIFDDAVAYGGWPVDLHVPGGLFAFDKKPTLCWPVDSIYTIPYRSLYSRNISNLMFAGRTISASKLAMSSSRVMGTCSVVGQAVGTAAAMCVEKDCDPREINGFINVLKQKLIKDDCYIPGSLNIDADDYALTSLVSATSELPGYEAINVIKGPTRITDTGSNMWQSDKIGLDGEVITLKLNDIKKVRQVRLTFDSNLSRPIKITMSDKRKKQQLIGIPPELVSDYEITMKLHGETVGYKKISGNYQRHNIVNLTPQLCDAVKVRILSTAGITTARIFEIRIY